MRVGAVIVFEVVIAHLLAAFRGIDAEVSDPLGWSVYPIVFAMANAVGLIPAIGVGHLVGMGIQLVECSSFSMTAGWCTFLGCEFVQLYVCFVS
jgi:hypothetical protein